jgi:hypothetical protein
MRRFECALGRGPQGEGVRNVRSLITVASLAALFAISNSTIGNAASANQRAYVSYASASSHAPQMSRAQQEPVPANCIRQECGKLWCWQMNNGAKTSH